MTYEEALRYAKSYMTVEGVPIDSKEATACIIEALEKQIPILPDLTDEYCDVAVCPRCQQYEFESGTTTWQIAYCPNCGQAIDWSDIE